MTIRRKRLAGRAGLLLAIVLGVTLVVLLASSASTAGPALARPGDLVRRLNAGCDVVMAAAMTVMVVQML